MTDKELFGAMQAARGDKCQNDGYGARWTTPCCYTDLEDRADTCPTCGAPIICTVEEQPVSVCRIKDADE